MAYQGEYFVERYGARAAEATPPVKAMLEAGVPVGAGTDATLVSSHNPWVCLSWLATGMTVGGLQLTPERHLLDRHTALRLWPQANTWFSHDEGRKGQIVAGQYADFAVLSADHFGIPDSDIADLYAELTVMGGKVVHGNGPFADFAPPLPPVSPDWSPLRRFGAHQHRHPAVGLFTCTGERTNLGCGCGTACGVHAHAHVWDRAAPAGDARSFWGALGCSCWAF